jgi:hypothetical protein
LRRRRPQASTQLSERQGTQTPSLAPRAPHPGSNRRWKRTTLSYSFVNESRGQVRGTRRWGSSGQSCRASPFILTSPPAYSTLFASS